MEFKQENNRFYMGDASAPQAEMNYRLADDVMIIDRTFVSDDLRGQGIARRLVETAVEWAKANDYRIDARCWYAKKVMQADPEFSQYLI